jgi:glycosyltransferase involved in cell wall biosynthesis
VYSFGILTYNQENDIVRALESVKYQVEHFANGKEVELIVSDDASKDGTTRVTQKWTQEYGEIFTRVKLISNEENVGTCKNISGVYREVTGDFFFCFAGDDAISQNNIFEYLDSLEKYDIESSGYCAYINGKVLDDQAYYNRVCSRSYQKSSELKYLSVARVPIDGPTMAFKKEYLTDELIDFISKYKLIEDRPTVYYLSDRIENIQYRFCPKIYMLYQHSENSVSHQNKGQIRSASMTDLINFYAFCMRNADSLGAKWTAACNYMRYSGNKIFKYLNFPYYLLTIKDAFHRKDREKTYQVLQEQFDTCQAHLDYLERKRSEFMENVRLQG